MADDEKIYQRAERPPYMQRIRNVRPEFFKHEALFDLERETGLPIRLGYEGLWTCCDREGRFQWRPRRLVTDILPYDGVDFSRVLDALATRGFVVRYEVDGEVYGCVPSWHKNQSINAREAQSYLPPPPETLSGQQIDACPTGASRVPDACPTRATGVGVGVGDVVGVGDETSAPDGAVTKRGTRIPEPFLITEEHRQFAIEHDLPTPDSQLGVFVDYWRGVPGKRGLKVDWDATFRNWLRKSKHDDRNRYGKNKAEQRQANNLAALEAAFPMDR